jgi:hypothetical protein
MYVTTIIGKNNDRTLINESVYIIKIHSEITRDIGQSIKPCIYYIRIREEVKVFITEGIVQNGYFRS